MTNENDDQTGELTAISMAIPPFEGRHVHGVAFKITGALPMEELEHVTVSVDDVVNMLAQFKVIKVHHDANEKGELLRTHVLRPIMMAVVPMDPTDEDDDGIIRALPEVVEKKVEPVCTCNSHDTQHERTCMLTRLLGMSSAMDEGEKITIGFAPKALGTPAAGE